MRSRYEGKVILLSVILILAMASVSGRGIGFAQDARPALQASPAAGNDLIAQGEQIFNSVCLACHQPGGTGIAGIYPQLAGNPLVTVDDPTYVVTVLLNGRGGMPRFDGSYTDEEIAAIATYIRGGLGDNRAGPVDPAFVADLRAQVTDLPQGSPTPEGQEPSGIAATPDAGATPVT
jgi:mono/diheme cytochrome c family protein